MADRIISIGTQIALLVTFFVFFPLGDLMASALHLVLLPMEAVAVGLEESLYLIQIGVIESSESLAGSNSSGSIFGSISTIFTIAFVTVLVLDLFRGVKVRAGTGPTNAGTGFAEWFVGAIIRFSIWVTEPIVNVLREIHQRGGRKYSKNTFALSPPAKFVDRQQSEIDECYFCEESGEGVETDTYKEYVAFGFSVPRHVGEPREDCLECFVDKFSFQDCQEIGLSMDDVLELSNNDTSMFEGMTVEEEARYLVELMEGPQ